MGLYTKISFTFYDNYLIINVRCIFMNNKTIKIISIILIVAMLLGIVSTLLFL